MRRSSTSTFTPCFASWSAACNATSTILPKHTIVQWSPSRFSSAFPIGTMRSGLSSTSPFVLYSISFSNTITGLSSRIAALSSPLASAGVPGETTLRPGICANQLSHACECCAPNCSAEPLGPRNTIGILYCPLDIYNILAAALTT